VEEEEEEEKEEVSKNILHYADIVAIEAWLLVDLVKTVPLSAVDQKIAKSETAVSNPSSKRTAEKIAATFYCNRVRQF